MSIKRKRMIKLLLRKCEKKAMKRMGQAKKRKSQEDNEGEMKDRRKRRSGSDAVEFLKENCEREMALREKEIEMKKNEQDSGFSFKL